MQGTLTLLQVSGYNNACTDNKLMNDRLLV